MGSLHAAFKERSVYICEAALISAYYYLEGTNFNEDMCFIG